MIGNMNKEYLRFLFKKSFEAEKRLEEYKNTDKVYTKDSEEICNQYEKEKEIALNREFISAESAIEMYLFHHK